MDANAQSKTEDLDFTQPTAECDLVMKGGITSGVVYPPAIVKLATRYRFRNIGGTSAGAIAAGAAAAAEFGREQGGFEHLVRVRDQLAKEGFIFNLFQPSHTTRPLMNILFTLAAESKKQTRWRIPRLGWRLTQALLQHQPKSFARGALLSTGVASAYAALVRGMRNPGSLVPPLVLLGWIGGLVKGGYDLSRILLNEVPQNNFFGICTGLNDGPADEGSEVLTAWLSEQINLLAGRAKHDQPLTFRELSGKRVQSEDRSIRLRVVTTNLSQSRPYIIPFDTNAFLFKKSDMQRLFPPSVVKYMTDAAYHDQDISLERLPDFCFLPEGEALPVVVGMRLSLSFPLLISAVPLYTIKLSVFRHREQGKPLVLEYDDVREAGDLQKNWFSDGGICSNFPIHFFDAWLPRRPTFGINLTQRPEETFRQDHTATDPDYQSCSNVSVMDAAPWSLRDDAVISKAVYIPRADELLAADWTEITSLLDFANAIFSSAQNYRDTMQSMLPSYRDRIVQVRFAPHEGGMNLAMTRDTIEVVQSKGEKAAQKILDHFKLSHHQWVRFQVLMALMERQLGSLERAIHEANYEEVINQQAVEWSQTDPSKRYPYAQPQDWCDEALRRITALQEFIKQLNAQEWLVDSPPRPEAVLRVTPEL